MSRILSPIRSAIGPPVRSPLLRGGPRLVLPYSTGLIVNLLPDSARTDRDDSSTTIRVRGSGPATPTQDQTDTTKRLLWSPTSTIGGRASLSKGANASPFLRTQSGLALSQPFVVYMVLAPPFLTPTTLLFDGSSASARAALGYIGTNTFQVVGSTGAVTGVVTVTEAGALFVCVFDGSSSEMRVNGSSLATGTTTTSAPLDFFNLNVRYSGGNPSGGPIGYFGVQTGHPTTTQLQSNEAALKQHFTL